MDITKQLTKIFHFKPAVRVVLNNRGEDGLTKTEFKKRLQVRGGLNNFEIGALVDQAWPEVLELRKAAKKEAAA